MPNFEPFILKAEKLENKPDESSEERRKNVIEKLANKFPKLRSIILAFITTTAGMSAPELIHNIPPQRTKIEQKISAKEETAESALEKVSDANFKEFFRRLKNEMDQIGNDVPDNSLYSEVSEYLSVNNGITINENMVGNIPESAKDVIISYQLVVGDYIQDKAHSKVGVVNIMDGSKKVFYISPVEEGQIVEGGKIEIEGVGLTQSEALQNALEEAITYLGTEVASDDSLNETIREVDELSSYESIKKSITKNGGEHFIKEYKVLKVEQGKGKVASDNKYYHVTLEITGGRFVPEK